DGVRALVPAVCNRSGSCRNGARAGREGFAGASLPDADREVVRTVDPDELDVRAFRKACVPLDAGPEPPQLGALGFAADHGVRVADRHRRELDPLVAEVEQLRLPHFDLPDVEPDEAAVADDRLDL